MKLNLSVKLGVGKRIGDVDFKLCVSLILDSPIRSWGTKDVAGWVEEEFKRLRQIRPFEDSCWAVDDWFYTGISDGPWNTKEDFHQGFIVECVEKTLQSVFSNRKQVTKKSFRLFTVPVRRLNEVGFEKQSFFR